jgi:hypothetical protein
MNTRRIAHVLLLSGVMAAGPAAASSPPASIRPAVPSAATVPTLDAGEELLTAGTYRIELESIPSGTRGMPAVVFTVPDGWHNGNGWALYRAPEAPDGEAPIVLSFWDVGRVYAHPCQWRGTLYDPGPSVAELADALAVVPLRNATQPEVVTLDGRPGEYLEWSVPPDIDFADCDVDGVEAKFESWSGRGGGDRYQQGPGQLDRLWIIDVDGHRVVIDASDKPFATDAQREELLDIVRSIRFELSPGASPATTH